MKVSAQDVYNMLMHDDKILDLTGQIRFSFGDIDITVKQKDVVGNIIQEWLREWLNKRGIEHSPSQNTQMPPDFYLNPDDKTVGLLEVKAFNRSASPAFDIADFRMFQDKIVKDPYILHADYLIFGYDMNDGGDVTVKDLWIKKVWEITRCMEKWALNLQIKDGVVYNIRPGVWYSKKSKYPMFSCLEHFISAVEETVFQNPKTHNDAGSWKNRFLESYKRHYGQSLAIPHWSDIAAEYGR